MSGKYLTPDTAAGLTACRRLIIPVELLGHVNAALLDLCADYRWDELGTMTVTEAVELCQEMFRGYIEGSCMIGSVHPYAGSLPSGVLACDGATHARVDYPLLYAMLDAAYITDADYFVTPDLRGRAVIGTGTGAGLTTRAMNDIGGEESHQLTAGEMPSHTHSYQPPAVNPDVEGPGIPDIGATVLGLPTVTGSAGSDQSHNNMQPYVALTWGIVAI